ncbi:MAG TPA: tetratricopeptide repeat protein [Myxococcales bacterium]
MSRTLPQEEAELQCTCGMELGKKLDAIEHLVATAKACGGDGKEIKVDLRSSLPWGRGGKASYFELELIYGAQDEGSLKVQVDDKARKFRIGDEEKDLAWLQPEIEHRQLLRMLGDALTNAQAKGAMTLATAIRRLQEAAGTVKPLDPASREAMRLTPLAPEGEEAAGLRALCGLIDRSAERWFVPLAGLTPHELEERFAKVGRSMYSSDLTNARRQLEELVKLLPENADARGRLGALLATAFADHRLSEGIANLEKALALAPAHRSAGQDLADALFRNGNLDRSRQLYQKALETTGVDSPQCLFGLGQIDELAGNLDGAYSFYVRAARKASDVRLRQVLELCASRVERVKAKRE